MRALEAGQESLSRTKEANTINPSKQHYHWIRKKSGTLCHPPRAPVPKKIWLIIQHKNGKLMLLIAGSRSQQEAHHSQKSYHADHLVPSDVNIPTDVHTTRRPTSILRTARPAVQATPLSRIIRRNLNTRNSLRAISILDHQEATLAQQGILVLGDIQEDLVDIQEDLVDIQEDLVDIQEDLVDIQEDLEAIQEDLVGTREDLVGTREDLVDIQEDLADIQEDLEGIQVDTREDLVDIREDLAGIREDHPVDIQVDIQEDPEDIREDLEDIREGPEDQADLVATLEVMEAVQADTLAHLEVMEVYLLVIQDRDRRDLHRKGSELLPEINKEEIKAALQRAKNNKASGEDNIVIEAIKREETACSIELWSFSIFACTTQKLPANGTTLSPFCYMRKET
ncbi:hypothetical protein HUJ05_005224 [Dendroctonus ponderosae]|nr:hypothetical protein HUJ05_005224 [Dendroctonus ponderosae]